MSLNFSSQKITSEIVGIISIIYLAWIGAWILFEFLESNSTLVSTDSSTFFYWFGIKLIVWILPAVYIARMSKVILIDFNRVKLALKWGIGFGLILGIFAIIPKILSQQPILSLSFSWSLLSAVIVSPILEEMLFRGAILPALKQKYRFLTANIITSTLFLGLHLPGWYFQGVLGSNLTTPIGGALSIFLLSLVFGYVTHKSKTSLGGIIAHVLNNFFNV